MPAPDLLRHRYDETPYHDPEISDFDLPRLLGLAKLFGLGPAAEGEDPLRVLDLACSSGTQVRRQAERYPGVHFTGVDFAQSEIDIGRKAIEEAGLANVELIAADLREFEPAARQFDVVLCHGAFSWVPDEVKERVFEVARLAMKPTGLAAIAYLTYPGWKQREAVRELVVHHASKSNEPQERVRDAARVLRLLRASYASIEGSPHAASLLETVESMQRSSANAFLHDELGAIHDPCYFTQFVEWAGEWGLQYLCESDLGTMSLEGLPDAAHGLLHELSPDFIETQQLIDFLVNRTGRSSILVPSDARVARRLDDEPLRALRFTTRLHNATLPDPERAEALEFLDATGRRVHTADTTSHAMIRALIDAAPHSSTVDRLERAMPTADVLPTLRALLAAGHAEPIFLPARGLGRADGVSNA